VIITIATASAVVTPVAVDTHDGSATTASGISNT
jgi:hypothetical protein